MGCQGAISLFEKKGETAMTQKLVVEGSTVSASQLKDFFRQINDGSITGPIVQAVLDRRNPFGAPAEERKVQVVSADSFANGGVTYAMGLDVAAFLADWTKFYQEVWNVDFDFSSVLLPPVTPGFGWGVAVTQGMTVQKAYEKCIERFGAYKYDDRSLDVAVPTNVRDAINGSYIIWLRDRVEADEELKNKSAKQLEDNGIDSNTLTERLLLELWYHWKTGGHLDIKNVTLCAGSRYSVGYVPYVYWGTDDRALYVDWCRVDFRGDGIRSRQAVSTPKVA